MNKHVLIVEDDRVSREALTFLLRNLGHEVRACWSAEDAKVMIAEYAPDVALLDVRLPGLPGDAFAIYLKKKHPDTRIIFVSGEFRLDAPERFGDDVTFLSKPLDFERLLSTLEN